MLHVPAAVSYQVRQSPAPAGGQRAAGLQPDTDSSHWTELWPGGWRVVPGMGTAVNQSTFCVLRLVSSIRQVQKFGNIVTFLFITVMVDWLNVCAPCMLDSPGGVFLPSEQPSVKSGWAGTAGCWGPTACLPLRSRWSSQSFVARACVPVRPKNWAGEE